MTLAQHLSTLIDQDLQDLRKTHATQLHEKQMQQEDQLRGDRLQYQQQISDAVAQQVNLKNYQSRQATVFDHASALRQRIDEAYRLTASQLLRSKFGTQALQSVMTGVPLTTTITISGEHATVLRELITQLGFQSVQMTTGTGLGTLSYTLDKVVGEFTVEEFLEFVKKKTIGKLMSAVS